MKKIFEEEIQKEMNWVAIAIIGFLFFLTLKFII